jgi:hypothetical protein
MPSFFACRRVQDVAQRQVRFDLRRLKGLLVDGGRRLEAGAFEKDNDASLLPSRARGCPLTGGSDGAKRWSARIQVC